MADNRAAMKTAIANGLATAHGQGLKATDTALANVIGDAVAVFALALKGRADAAGPSPMLDSLSGAVTGTTTME